MAESISSKRPRTEGNNFPEDTIAPSIPHWGEVAVASLRSRGEAVPVPADVGFHGRSHRLIGDAISELINVSSLVSRARSEDNSLDYELQASEMLRNAERLLGEARRSIGRNHIGRLQEDLRRRVIEYLDLSTLPPRLALASIDRSWREFIYKSKECRDLIWDCLNFHTPKRDEFKILERNALIPPALKERFADADLRRLLTNIGARDHTYAVCIEVGGAVVGHGLAPISESHFLEELEITMIPPVGTEAREDCNEKCLRVEQLLDSFSSRFCEEFVEASSRFRLQRVALFGHGWRESEEQALATLEKRMKDYWKPIMDVKCSYCKKTLQNTGHVQLQADENPLVAEVRPDWCCSHCFKPSCQQGSCPIIQYCQSRVCASTCRGPFCMPCYNDTAEKEGFEISTLELKCCNCQKGVCLHCAKDFRCFNCTNLCCGTEGSPACEIHVCPRCNNFFCSECVTLECERCYERVCKKCNVNARSCSTCGEDFCGVCVRDCSHGSSGSVLSSAE